jgi:hypothetical protein
MPLRVSGRRSPRRGSLCVLALGSTIAASAMLAPSAAAQSGAMADSQPPAQIHYKGLTLTPIGYFTAEAVWREKNETADIGSSFNAIPFSGTTNAYMSEFRGSARQSRIGLLATGTAGTTKLSGLWESDFLAAGISSNSNESNSYALRIRQFWGQAALANGWSFLGGQMWSLITTNKLGIAPRQEFVPLLIDAQYSAGFNWARQFGVRVTNDIGDKAWIALAAEGAQTTFSAHGANNNFVIGQVGGSQLNSTVNYSTDLAPDVIAKLAFEPGFGHYEIKLLGRVFRDRVIDTTVATGGTPHNSQQFGGGVGAGAVWAFNMTEPSGKKRDVLDVGVSGLWGNGIGRYAAGQLADATVRPNGEVVPIRAAQGLVTVEAHPMRKLDLYGYAGGEYEYRTAFLNGAKGEGYGSPLFSVASCTEEFPPTGPFAPGAPGGPTAVAGVTNPSCNADTRALVQGNLGFWYRFYQGSAGTVAWGLQYSYTARNTWSGAKSLQPQALDQMIFTSFRYYVP